jgi:putative cardiolipin synthase
LILAVVTYRRQLALLGFTLLLAACTSVPFDYPRVDSEAIPAATDTYYGSRLQDWKSEHGELSGFMPLLGGIDALGVRLVMMETAESSIDAQYFLIKPDQAGDLFLGKLLRAADRGVRVRLLVDDIFTPRRDSIFAVLNSHPNVEVRLFNPLSRLSPKSWNMLLDFKRVNRRMHNKAFIVDGALAITGGRNIAEEYFELKDQQEFDDFEVLMYGDIVPQLSHSFDIFWNSELSVPMEAFGDKPGKQGSQRWLDHMDQVISGERSSPYARAINSTLLQQIRDREIEPFIGPADFVYDLPEKLQVSTSKEEYRVLADELRQRMEAATREIIIVTPYFVPRPAGIEWIRKITGKGIQLVIVTNSLASTNHVAVHSGYARYRRQVLEAGAKLYEIKVDPPGGSINRRDERDRVTLHTKAVLIDRDELFVGSLNFDPRSIVINTEVGLFIHDDEMTAYLSELIWAELPQYAYRVELNEKGKLRWYYDYLDQDVVYTSEPQSGFWRRFTAGFYGLLPIEAQL